MKRLDEYEKIILGYSDRGLLILDGYDLSDPILPYYGDPLLRFLHFEQDLDEWDDRDMGSYSAFLVDKDCFIPECYTLCYTFYHGLRIYDDESLTWFLNGYCFKIYRSGNYDCIIQEFKQGEL